MGNNRKEIKDDDYCKLADHIQLVFEIILAIILILIWIYG